MKVFLGSTYIDLQEHRSKSLEVLSQFSHAVEAMEDWEAAPDAPLSHCLECVGRSDLYICLVAFRYGSVADEGLSFTHHEYRYARELGKDILALLMSDSHPIPTAMADTGLARENVEQFRAELQQNHICSFFGSPSDLAKKLAKSISNYLVDKQIVTPADIKSSWHELSEAWKSVEPDDIRVDFDADKNALALLDDADDVARGLEFLANQIQVSHDSLEADIKQLMHALGFDVSRLETIHYWENPFVNRDWELVHMGFPNWLTHLCLLLTQIRVRHLELLAETDRWDETSNLELIEARRRLKRLLESSARVD